MELDTPYTSQGGRRHVYPMPLKKRDDLSVSYSVVRNWKHVSEKIDKFEGNNSRPTCADQAARQYNPSPTPFCNSWMPVVTNNTT
ncbi:hypothetical protein H257_19244 [Aphanomyces astaci]|uniref:Uncharacterized protein n=1 Tax=Aphanomyces astaci TaxID=112090 RepID=W4FAS2_APHAT|nr:hypothetical protein H257_19244 [Aphanomyces astaci]ETV63823.1 hypothetical protein H257_19244 [Aphanomyces astaci]|eukprot:XP_009846693.1 hypothetical protein H257_19244 [Aphanomyces astaci]